MVHAAVAPGCFHQAGAEHQAGRNPGRRGQRACAPPAPAAGRRRARTLHGHHPGLAGQAPQAIPVDVSAPSRTQHPAARTLRRAARPPCAEGPVPKHAYRTTCKATSSFSPGA
ncbi:hypothetical protein G6F22_021198 [Rhizopus arrhizus]|nr:hypothetical protein G6F22_021198 [Rhizopus arrhizus]